MLGFLRALRSWWSSSDDISVDAGRVESCGDVGELRGCWTEAEGEALSAKALGIYSQARQARQASR